MNIILPYKTFFIQLEDVLKERKRDLKDAQQKELDRMKDEHERNLRQLREDYQEKVSGCAGKIQIEDPHKNHCNTFLLF